jgi:hypothetical protein
MEPSEKIVKFLLSNGYGTTYHEVLFKVYLSEDPDFGSDTQSFENTNADKFTSRFSLLPVQIFLLLDIGTLSTEMYGITYSASQNY